MGEVTVLIAGTVGLMALLIVLLAYVWWREHDSAVRHAAYHRSLREAAEARDQRRSDHLLSSEVTAEMEVVDESHG